MDNYILTNIYIYMLRNMKNKYFQNFLDLDYKKIIFDFALKCQNSNMQMEKFLAFQDEPKNIRF